MSLSPCWHLTALWQHIHPLRFCPPASKPRSQVITCSNITCYPDFRLALSSIQGFLESSRKLLNHTAFPQCLECMLNKCSVCLVIKQQSSQLINNKSLMKIFPNQSSCFLSMYQNTGSGVSHLLFFSKISLEPFLQKAKLNLVVSYKLFLVLNLGQRLEWNSALVALIIIGLIKFRNVISNMMNIMCNKY